MASLAGSVPGRALAARVGFALAALGLLLAMVCGPLFYAWTGSAMGALACELKAFALALVPGVVMLSFIRRGYPGRPLLAVAGALAGSLGFGALAVHLSCPLEAAPHVFLGHALAPVAWTALLTIPADRALFAR